jgi:DNA-binding transcriptional LysR family regulator
MRSELDFNLSQVEFFCRVAELGSFTEAAAAVGVTRAAVTRAIQRLEARLNVQLLVRTTRQVSLTDAGRNYFDQCKQALALLDQAERDVSGAQSEPSGLVRMSLPTSYGHFRVLPVLGEFRAKYPKVDLDLHVSNRNVDLIAENFDLAIRGRTPPDSGMVARKLEDVDQLIVAAPKYLRERGAPAVIDELDSHDCIRFCLPSTGQAVPWSLRAGDRFVDYMPQRGARCYEDILAPVTLARSGFGLAHTYRFLVERELADGSLVEVLEKTAGASRPFSIIYPSNRRAPLRVRLLIEFLVERFRR